MSSLAEFTIGIRTYEDIQHIWWKNTQVFVRHKITKWEAKVK